MFDLKSSVGVVTAIEPIVAGATVASGPIDLAGYNSCAIAVSYGAVTATAATFTVQVTEGDTTGGAFTPVADADLNGTEADASLGAAVRVDGSTEKVTKKVGYVGSKRYIKVAITPTATIGAIVDAVCILGNAANKPVA